MQFDSKNPFPLIPIESIPYHDEKTHAEAVDRWLKIDAARVEAQISAQSKSSPPSKEFWVGLAIQSLSTPYTEIRQILNMLDPQPGDTLIDLGASYGRIAHVLNRHHPGVRFIGYEVMAERVREGERVFALHGTKNARLEQADLGAKDFKPEVAGYYFMYDFGSREDVEKCVQDLRSLATPRKPITVVGRGGRVRDIIEKEHAWLSQVVEPEHFGRFSIYRSAGLSF